MAAQRRFEERNSEILAGHHAGETIQDLALRHGLSQTRIRGVLLDLGVETRIRRKNADRDAVIAADFEQGMSPSDLAGKYRLSEVRVLEILRELGARSDLGTPRDLTALIERFSKSIDRWDSEVVCEFEAEDADLSHLKGSERILYMSDLSEAGLTLQEIGDRFGISRERVRQLLRGAGGYSAEAAREARRSAQEKRRTASVAALAAQYGSTVAELAGDGLTRSEIETVLTLLEPNASPDTISRAVSGARIEFDQGPSEPQVSDDLLREAVWLSAGLVHECVSNGPAALELLDPEVSSELASTLHDQSAISAEHLAVILRVIAGAKEASGSLELTLSKNQYDEVRKQLQQLLGSNRTEGKSTWPPTSQTVMKRLGQGYWAEAMSAVGLAPGDRGRERGLLKFTESDYRKAVADYVNAADSLSHNATFAGYGRWVHQEERAGRLRPSDASVRLHFGAWPAAKRAVRSSASTNMPVSTNRHSLSAAALARSEGEIEAAFANFSEKKPSEVQTSAADLLRDLAQEFEIARRGWLRRMAHLDESVLVRQRNNAGLSNRVVKAIEAGESVDSLLTDIYLDSMLKAGDPRFTDGWVEPAAQAQLDAITELDVARYRVVRALRNVFTHDSAEALARAGDAIAALAELDQTAALTDRPTRRQLSQWLVKSNLNQLRRLTASIPEIWRRMVVAETLMGLARA